MVLSYVKAFAAAATIAVSAPALAVEIPDGTVTFVALFNPAVTYTTTPGTATFAGLTFEVSGTGGFLPAMGQTGTLSGTLSFANTVGAAPIDQTIPNFFSFNAVGGSVYRFSVDSVQTQTYSVNPGVSESFSLYLLGTTSNAALGYDPTATSLTLSFNQTGSSGYSASGTLAVPPTGLTVPEPATWGLFILGFGAIGARLRHSRPRVFYTEA